MTMPVKHIPEGGWHATGHEAAPMVTTDGHHRPLLADQPFDLSTLVFYLLTTDVGDEYPESDNTGPVMRMSGCRFRCSPGTSRRLWRGCCGPGTRLSQEPLPRVCGPAVPSALS